MTLINISFSERFNKKNIRIGEYGLDALIQRYMYFEYIYHCKLQTFII